MAEALIQTLQHYFSPSVVVFLISLLPLLELRGGMIAARLLGLPWAKAIIISIIGNILPIPFIILFIEKILRWMRDHGPFKGVARWIDNKGAAQGAKMQAKYPKQMQLGLFLFVAIPLPGTGAWTGALIASFLGLPPKKSAPYIGLGVLGAGIVMSIITYVIPAIVWYLK
ncbi:MAG: small multi-drug export protein [Clostridiales bacterium]|jgi:uncharacterized membrane protein|nr:small multi-drug export protein [Clostridiales bacterium]